MSTFFTFLALFMFVVAAGLWVAVVVQLAWEIVQWMWAMDETSDAHGRDLIERGGQP